MHRFVQPEGRRADRAEPKRVRLAGLEFSLHDSCIVHRSQEPGRAEPPGRPLGARRAQRSPPTGDRFLDRGEMSKPSRLRASRFRRVLPPPIRVRSRNSCLATRHSQPASRPSAARGRSGRKIDSSKPGHFLPKPAVASSTSSTSCTARSKGSPGRARESGAKSCQIVPKRAKSCHPRVRKLKSGPVSVSFGRGSLSASSVSSTLCHNHAMGPGASREHRGWGGSASASSAASCECLKGDGSVMDHQFSLGAPPGNFNSGVLGCTGVYRGVRGFVLSGTSDIEHPTPNPPPASVGGRWRFGAAAVRAAQAVGNRHAGRRCG
jgi:hypothetical protein